jgi:hypothetical protein
LNSLQFLIRKQRGDDFSSVQNSDAPSDCEDEEIDKAALMAKDCIICPGLLKCVRNDFFGYLRGKHLVERKISILKIYRFFFRFSVVKMKEYVDEPILILLTIQYLKDTKMQRIHQRDVLQKNYSTYYRAMENIINNSPHK